MISTEIVTRSTSASKSDFVCDREETKKFLSLFGGAEFTFNCFDYRKNLQPRNYYGTLSDHYTKLVKHNEEGYCIFFTVNRSQSIARKKEDIVAVRALFVDFDIPGDLPKFHIEPSIIVESSPKKYHAYWCVDDCNLDDFKKQQQKLIDYYKSDETICDLPRVMRLPGFCHRKGEPFLTRIVEASAKNYSILDAALPSQQASIVNIPQVLSNVVDVRTSTQAQAVVVDDDYRARLKKEIGSTIGKIKKLKKGRRHNEIIKKCRNLAGYLACDPGLLNWAKKIIKEEIQDLIAKGTWDAPGGIHSEDKTVDDAFDNGVKEPQQLEVLLTELSKENQAREDIKNWLDDYGVVEWNEMSMCLEHERKQVRETYLRQRFLEHTNKSVSREDFTDIIVDIAKANSYHPAREYLESLPECEDIDGAFEILYRAMNLNGKPPIQKTQVFKWLIGAVARAMKPGCQMDNALVLKSLVQGLSKTSFFNVLFGEEFFQTSGRHKNEQDELLAFNLTWCSEWGEIETTFGKKDIGNMKNFVTTRNDRFREPYARATESHPRGFVLCGTTNLDRFLTDPTGNRRFWVVEIDNEIDLKSIRDNRDLIWSAAFTFYKQCMISILPREVTDKEDYFWWMTKDQEDLVLANTAASEQIDPLEDEIIQYAETNEYFTIPQLMKALELPRNMSDQRVANVLKKFGLIKPPNATRRDGTRAVWWRYDTFWEDKKGNKKQVTYTEPASNQPIANPAHEPAHEPTPQITPNEAKAFLHSPEALNSRLADLGSSTSPDYLAFKDSCLSSGYTAEQIQMLDAAVNYETQSMIDKF